MLRILLGVLVAGGLVWGQDGEKKPAPKPDGFKDGGGDKGPGPQLPVSEVDTNGDGLLSAAELKSALSKLGGGGPKEGGKKPGFKDGDGKKPEGPKDGEFKKPDGFKDGDVKKPAPKPDSFKGDAPKKDAPREGDDKKGEK